MSDKTLADFYRYCCYHYSEKTAIISGSERITFAALQQKGLRLSNALLGLGLAKGDCLAQLLPNCPEAIISDYACCRLGLPRIPLSTYLKAESIIMMMKAADVQVLVYDQMFSDQVKRVKEALPQVIYVRRGGWDEALSPGEYGLDRLIAEADEVEPRSAPVNADDIATISFTGGTTGLPKGVVHTHRTRVSVILMELLDFGIVRDEVFLAATPLTHAAGTIVLPVFLRGGCCVIMQGFDTKKFFDIIKKENVTSTFVVPTMIYTLLDDPGIKGYIPGTLRNILYGAAAINPNRLKEAVQIFGPVFTQLYGQAEAPMTICTLPQEEHIIDRDERPTSSRLASCGRPTLLSKVKIVNPEGKPVGTGNTGELVVKSPSVMKGYLSQPDLTAETIKDGWLHTGDIVRQDKGGHIYIVDRKKDMIVSGGFNIYPAEIENVLCEHPAVDMALVIGVPDSKWGEAVRAVIKLKPDQDISEAQLITFCKEKKGSVVAPKSIEFVADIPLTSLGKPDKKFVRDQYWSKQNRKI